MFGKIVYISDNMAHVEIPQDKPLSTDLMNMHVVFEDEYKKILGEVEDISSTLIKIRFLGEIYICYDRCVEQASEYGHSIKREFCYLAVHGLLHLLGYDHMTEEDKKVMRAEEESILNEYDITR